MPKPDLFCSLKVKAASEMSFAYSPFLLPENNSYTSTQWQLLAWTKVSQEKLVGIYIIVHDCIIEYLAYL